MTSTTTVGRPTAKLEAMSEKLSFRLTPWEYESFIEYCERYDATPSEVMRFALDVLNIIPIMSPLKSPPVIS
jgi:hypothetical protein